MATKQEDALAPLFSRLDSQIKAGQRKKALRTVEEGLKLSSQDDDLQRAKLYLLIDLDKIQEALALINQGKSDVSQKFAYEKAYCLYRLGDLQKALEVVEHLGRTHEEAKLQLKAQLCYRLGDYNSAVGLYNELFQQKVTGVNVKTNILAAYTASNRAKEVDKLAATLKISPEDGFEVAFNLACSTLQCGRIAEAKQCLLLALRTGRESLLEEDYTEEQADQELAPLKAQLSYVSAAALEHQAALDIIQELLSADSTDEGLRALIVNNSYAIKLLTAPQQRQVINEAIRETDISLEKGSSGLKLKASVESRISPSQQQALYVNRVLLQLLAGRHQSARDLTQQLAKRYKDAGGVALLRASLLARDGKLKDAEAAIASVTADKAEDLHTELQLMRAQLAVEASNHSQANSILSSLQSEDLQNKPALLATQATLLEASKQERAALDLFSQVQASQLADKQMSKAEKAALNKGVLPIISRLQLKVGAVSEAFKTFKQLHTLDASTASSADVVGQLAAAALEQDPAASSSLQEYLQSLPPMMPEDVDKLEEAGTGRMSKGKGKAGNGEAATNKRKRKRKTKLPKNFDPENPGPPPDPERWLPKWQRTEYKRKRRNRKEKAKIGHQGGAVDESLDRTHTESPAQSAAPPNLPRRKGGRVKGSRR